jgi:leucyl-tRNA synthetase
MWAALGHADPLVATSWPQPEGSALVRDEVELVVQVNGRKRGEIRVAADADAASAEAAALADPNVLRFLEGVTVRKVVVVPGRLVNIVAN